MTTEATENVTPAETKENVVANPADFTSLTESRNSNATATSIDRFKDVRVDVWAELGRVQIPIGELMEIGEGSVLRLDRSIGDTVDLVSQGALLARGEIVVVDDKFAIRIKEIEPAKE